MNQYTSTLPLSDTPPYLYLNSQEAFDQFMAETKLPERIAVDLEFDDNRYTYGKTICLIQLYFDGKAYLVDTLTVGDISALIAVFEDKAYRKVFHSCTADVLILQEVFQCYTKNIDDTSLMYKLASISDQSISLSGLIKEELALKLKKESQDSDWTRRPLTEKQLAYAATDVLHLFPIREKLLAKIKSENRLTWYDEERELLEHVRPSESDPAHKLITKHKLTDREGALIRALWEKYDGLAQQLDKPNYKIISHKRLVELAQNPPANRGEWQKIGGVHPRTKTPQFAAELETITQYTLENIDVFAAKVNEKRKRGTGDFLQYRQEKNNPEMQKRSLTYDLLRDGLEAKQGIGMRTLLLPNSCKYRVLKEGLQSLPKWRQQELRVFAKAQSLDLELLQTPFRPKEN